MTRIRKIVKLLLIIIMFSVSTFLQAQTNPGDQPPVDPPGGDNTIDNPVPFDGGVYCLVAVAIAYGFIKAYTKKVSIQNKLVN